MSSANCFTPTWLPRQSGTRSSSCRSRTSPKAGHQQFLALELLRRPGGQRILSLEPDLRPFDVALGVRLPGHEQPLERLGNPDVHGFVRSPQLRLGLLRLEGVEVQRFPVVPNRIPCQELANGALQFPEPIRIGREHDQRIAIAPRAVAPRFQDGKCLLPCRAAGVLRGVRELRPKNHQPGRSLVRNVGARTTGMDLAEGVTFTGLPAQPPGDFFVDIVIRSSGWPGRRPAG